MSTRKKISNCSQPTQSQHPKRFTRRNSFHTLVCRSGSLKKYQTCSEQLIVEQTPQPNINFNKPQNQPTTVEPSSPQLYQVSSRPYELSLKRGSGSMRIDPSHKEGKAEWDQLQLMRKQLEMRIKENEQLDCQCKRLKMYINQQRDKRKGLEEEMKLNRQEVKKLQKKVEKYKGEIQKMDSQKQKYQKEREIVMRHIQQMESTWNNPQANELQTIREKLMQGQLETLRNQLQKDRTARQQQLLNQVDKLQRIYYQLQAQLRSTNISKQMLAKQLTEREQEVQQIHQSVYQTVTNSYEYLQLRERYRRLLVEFREMAQELEQAERKVNNRTLEYTFLTVSQEEASQAE